MKPSRTAVTSVVLFGVLAAAGCGGRSKLVGDGGLLGDGRAGDGGGLAGTGGRTDGAGGNTGGTGGPGGAGGGGMGGGGAGGMGGVMLTGLGIDPPMARVGQGGAVDFRAIGRFSDGSTRDVTAQAAWASSAPGVAVVAAGRATARGAGSTVITAATMGTTASATMTVTGATLSSVTIDPANSTVPVGMKTMLRATASYSDGSKIDVTSQASWTSSEPGLAEVSGGVVGGLRAGTVGITATFQGVSARAVVRVTSASISALEISPQNATLAVMGIIQFSATAFYSDGTRGDVTGLVTWESSDRSILAISSQGFASALAPGIVGVSAVIGNVAAKTMVTVSRARLLAIRVTPTLASAPAGTTQAFRALGGYSDGTAADITTSVAWSSGNERVASVSNSPGSQGVATGLSAGGTIIAASLMGVTGQARFSVTEARVTGLTVAPRTATVAVRASQQLRAQATFSDGSQRDVTDAASWSIADPSIATISNSFGSAGTLTGLAAGGTTFTANYQGFSDLGRVTVTSATLTSVTIDPMTATLMAGTRRAFTATGTYSDGTSLDITSQVMWTIDSPMVASVSNAPGASGIVTGLSDGTTTLVAMLGMVGAKAIVIVTGSSVEQLNIAPVVPSVRVGESTLFLATVIRSGGASQNVTLMATWTSSNPMVAGLGTGPLGASRATCRAVGTTTITASYMGLSDSTVLTCTAMRMLTDLQVTPFAVSLVLGQAQPFVATAIFDDGSTQNVTGMTTWTSSAPMVADVRNMGGMGGRGTVTALSAGTATITGTYMGMSASGTVTVSDATLEGISIAPASLALRVGETQGLQVTALYSDGTTRNVTGMSLFSSSDEKIADVTNTGGRGQVTALAVGSTTITAAFMGVDASVDVTVTNPTISALQISPVNARLPKGNGLQYQAVAVFSDGSSRNVTALASWTSSDTAVAGVSNAPGTRGQVTTLATGTADISASFMGVSGETALTVTSATVTEVQVTPTNPTIPLNTSQPFQAVAIYSDFTSQNVTGLAGWASSDTTVAQVSNAGGRGLATGLTAGTAEITATFMGVAGSTTLTVSSATVKEIQVSPPSPGSPAGVTIGFTATAILSDNTSREVTAMVTWTSSDTAVAAISNVGGSRGVATALAAGTTTITASLGGASGTATYTVGTQTLDTIAIGPAMPSVAKGATLSLTATGNYSDGSTYPLTEHVTWISAMTSIATVSNATGSRGLASGVAAGSATIQAHFQGKTGSASLTVTP